MEKTDDEKHKENVDAIRKYAKMKARNNEEFFDDAFGEMLVEHAIRGSPLVIDEDYIYDIYWDAFERLRRKRYGYGKRSGSKPVSLTEIHQLTQNESEDVHWEMDIKVIREYIPDEYSDIFNMLMEGMSPYDIAKQLHERVSVIKSLINRMCKATRESMPPRLLRGMRGEKE